MPFVQWDREQRFLLPFNGLFWFSVLPDRRRSTPLHDVHDGLVHVVLRPQCTLWGDFHDLKIYLFLIAQAGIGGVAAPSLPVSKWQGREVFKNAAFGQWHTLPLDKPPIVASYPSFLKSRRCFRHDSRSFCKPVLANRENS